MKKIFCILSILTIVSPVFADENPTAVAGEPSQQSVTSGTLTASTLPNYPLAASHTATDSNAASAGYVKGAYNAAIKAVNKVADTIRVGAPSATSTGRAEIWIE